MLKRIQSLPLLTVLILFMVPFVLRVFNYTAHAMGHHSSSGTRKAESSFRKADPSIPDELEDKKEADNTCFIRVFDSIKVDEHESRPVPVVLVPLLS